jgi:hypothetical protein
LIVGSSEHFEGDDREKEMKLQTFELFRRDSRNVEILTYSELYDRADFIVNQKPAEPPAEAPATRQQPDPEPDFDDDIPF